MGNVHGTDVIYGAQSKEHAEALFKDIDKDKNGSLDMGEFERLVQAVLKRPPENAPKDGYIKAVPITEQLVTNITHAFFRLVLGEEEGRKFKVSISRAQFDENVDALGFLVASHVHGGFANPSVCSSLFEEPFTEKKKKMIIFGKPDDLFWQNYLAGLATGALIHRGAVKRGDVTIFLAVSMAMTQALKAKVPGGFDELQNSQLAGLFPSIYNAQLLPELERAARTDYGRHFN